MSFALPQADRSSSSSTAPTLELLARYSNRADEINPDGPNQAAHMRTVIFKGLKQRGQQQLTPAETARVLMEQGRKTEAYAEQNGLPGDWRALAKEAGRAAKAVNLPPHETLELGQVVAHAAAHADRNTLHEHIVPTPVLTPFGIAMAIETVSGTAHNETNALAALDAFHEGNEEAISQVSQASTRSTQNTATTQSPQQTMAASNSATPEQSNQIRRRDRFRNWLRNLHRSDGTGS